MSRGSQGGNVNIFNEYFNGLTGAGANGGPPLAGAADFTGTQYQGMNAIEGSFALSFGFEIAVNTAGEFFKNLAGVGLVMRMFMRLR